MSFDAIVTFLEKKEEPKFRIQQFREAYFQGKCLKVEELTMFPLSLRSEIIETFGNELLPLTVLSKIEDEQSCKYLFKLNDGARIESVYMRFHEGIKSICISTQVGCACGCRFCATGGIGFKRNLTAEEIVAQVLYVAKTTEGIDRITIMGMGEALLNPNIFQALQCLSDPKGFGISPRRISVSTVGVIPGIYKLTELCPQTTLTFSLHFPEQSLREQWMPTAKKYLLNEIFQALDHYVTTTKHKVYLAYTIIDKINNRLEDLNHLSRLIKSRGDLAYLYHINLIPFHPIESLTYPGTPRSIAIAFQKELEKRGIEATVRQSFGKSIRGACGQLAAGYQQKEKSL